MERGKEGGIFKVIDAQRQAESKIKKTVGKCLSSLAVTLTCMITVSADAYDACQSSAAEAPESHRQHGALYGCIKNQRTLRFERDAGL